MATDKTLQCVLVTPERAVFDKPADMVILPMIDGELGVQPGRAALVGRLALLIVTGRWGTRSRRPGRWCSAPAPPA